MCLFVVLGVVWRVLVVLVVASLFRCNVRCCCLCFLCACYLFICFVCVLFVIRFVCLLFVVVISCYLLFVLAVPSAVCYLFLVVGYVV